MPRPPLIVALCPPGGDPAFLQAALDRLGWGPLDPQVEAAAAALDAALRREGPLGAHAGGAATPDASAEALAFADALRSRPASGPAALRVREGMAYGARAWWPALESGGYEPLAVLAQGDPMTHAARLAGEGGGGLAQGALDWLGCVLGAEAATRGRARTILGREPTRAAVDAALRGLASPGRATPGPVGPAAPASPQAAAPGLGAWVEEVRTVLGRWSRCGDDEDGRAALDAIRRALGPAVAALDGGRVAPTAAEALLEAGAVIERQRRELGEVARALAEAQEACEAAQARIARLEAERAPLIEAVGHGRDRIAELSGDLMALRRSTSWRLTAPVRVGIAGLRGVRRRFRP